MANSLYAQLAGTANSLLKQFGQGTIRLVTMVEGAGDPDEPETPGPITPTYQVLNAVARGVDEQHVDGSSVVTGDLQVTFGVLDASGLPVDPSTDDKLEIDGRLMAIKLIKRVPSAGDPVTFIAFVAG